MTGREGFEDSEHSERFDVLVVGAGIAGSLLAKELGERGWRVLVLEAGVGDADGGGPAADPARFRAARAKTPGSAVAPNPLVPSPDVTDLSGRPGGGYRAAGHLLQDGPLPYASGYVRVNGGTGTAWTGLTPRMHPEDFRTAEHFGYGRDWPIGYAELEPHYRAAERELGVAGDPDQQRELVGLPLPEGYAFPHRPVPASHLDRLLAERLDGRHARDPGRPDPVELRVAQTPQARNTAATREHGPVCEGSASCIPVCPTGAKYTPARTQRRWGPSVTLLTRAVAGRLTADPSGRITGVEYQRYEDPARPGSVTRHTARADTVVLAAHAIENARLLLASGLAGSSGQVGRNLMDHPVLLTWGLLPRRTGPYRGPGSTSGLEGFRFGPGRAARAPFRVEFGNWGWTWAVGPPEHEAAARIEAGLLGPALRRALDDRVGRQFALQFEMEQSADPANRVRLAPGRPDALGLPRPVLTYDLSEHVKAGIAAAKSVSDQLFALVGAEDHSRYAPGTAEPGRFEHEGRSYAYRGAGHAGGTHIMGARRSDSVVDSWQRCWDHPNLYAVGCGSMPSLGTSNPTLTMAAITLRSAERIHRDLTGRHRAIALPSLGRAPAPAVPEETDTP